MASDEQKPTVEEEQKPTEQEREHDPKQASESVEDDAATAEVAADHAAAGVDSDDLFIYFGYLSKLNKFILSLNHERHGILKSIEKTNENIMYVPETKIEIRLDWRKKIQ